MYRPCQLLPSSSLIEGLAAVYQTGRAAYIIPSKRALKGVVRDSTSRLSSPEEVLDKIIPWIESRAKLLEILGKKNKEAGVGLPENFVEDDFWDSEVRFQLFPYQPSFLIHPTRSLKVASSQRQHTRNGSEDAEHITYWMC